MTTLKNSLLLLLSVFFVTIITTTNTKAAIKKTTQSRLQKARSEAKSKAKFFKGISITQAIIMASSAYLSEAKTYPQVFIKGLFSLMAILCATIIPFDLLPHNCTDEEFTALTSATNMEEIADIKLYIENGGHIPLELKTHQSWLQIKETMTERRLKRQAEMLLSCNGTLGNPQARCIKELPYDVKLHILEWLGYFLTKDQYRAQHIPIPRLIPQERLEPINDDID